MNLLLLLSALLSALTGVGAAARGPVATQAVSVQVSAAAAEARAVRVAQRPQQSVATVSAVLQDQPLRAMILATVALYASRRRE